MSQNSNSKRACFLISVFLTLYRVEVSWPPLFHIALPILVVRVWFRLTSVGIYEYSLNQRMKQLVFHYQIFST